MKIDIDSNTDAESIPFCTECKHYYRDWSDVFFFQGHKYGKCLRPDGAAPEREVDLVSGRVTVKKPDLKHASLERKYDTDGITCGSRAKYFTPKNKFGTFKLLKRKDF